MKSSVLLLTLVEESRRFDERASFSCLLGQQTRSIYFRLAGVIRTATGLGLEVLLARASVSATSSGSEAFGIGFCDVVLTQSLLKLKTISRDEDCLAMRAVYGTCPMALQ